MKKTKKFFSFYGLGLSLVITSAFTCIWINVILCSLIETFDFLNSINYVFLYYFPELIICFILGICISKSEVKKRALIIAVLFEIGINLLVLIPWLLFYLIPTENVPSFIIDEPIFYMWYQNPISFAACCYSAESSAAIPAAISVGLSPAPVGFVYLFSKTPTLFKSLKREKNENE